MKLDHHRFVLRPDGTNEYRTVVLQFPSTYILLRVRTNRKPRQVLFTDFRRMQDDSRVKRKQVGRRDQEWIDINLLDPSLFGNKQTKPDKQSFKSPEINWCTAAHTFERLVYSSLLYYSSRQGAVQRRETEGIVLDHLDQLPS